MREKSNIRPACAQVCVFKYARGPLSSQPPLGPVSFISWVLFPTLKQEVLWEVGVQWMVVWTSGLEDLDSSTGSTFEQDTPPAMLGRR